MSPEERASWLSRLTSGERRALARLLTLAESRRREDGEAVNQLLQTATPPIPSALRIGITGIPGAGKSTLIEELGCRWNIQGKKVAVLAVDPSSVLTGGSVLGDKVRMPRLAQSERAFVRPIPSSGALGGVSVHLEDCARLCELAGYERILLETVGVGQSEVDVALLCDVLVSVAVPGTGDDVQAIKRGLWEVTDVLALNKIEREKPEEVEGLLAVYREGLGLVRGDSVAVVACSARDGHGVDDLERAISDAAQAPRSSRDAKRLALFRRLVETEVVRAYWQKANTSPEWGQVSERLRTGSLTLRAAVDAALRVG